MTVEDAKTRRHTLVGVTSHGVGCSLVLYSLTFAKLSSSFSLPKLRYRYYHSVSVSLHLAHFDLTWKSIQIFYHCHAQS